ncbi:MAG: hypothetical protein C4555_06475 [Dehalococcoidia bacterium]|nr:MAG: hypothetical protein C4555_06475 [Dehalococcoidia bacterium]
MLFQAACKTTAMGIMPHTDIDRALELAFGLDIPFWPQLPNVSFYEDMYVQASENFPGIMVDEVNKKLLFDNARFAEELPRYSELILNPDTFKLSERYSVVYHRFLSRDLSSYPAVRGQLIGPVSFGFRVTDENNRPVIYNDDVRTMLYDFIQHKVNAQYRELKAKNPRAFVWLDEPGLGWVFSGLSGYDDLRAKADYGNFLGGLENPGALHLCANVNLPYLLGMGTNILSFDAYQLELMPKGYARAVADFISNGGIIAWGIVPTASEVLSRETTAALADRLSAYWEVVSRESRIEPTRIAEQALIAPARCCLKNIGQVGACEEKLAGVSPASMSAEEAVVEKAFGYLKKVSEILKGRYGR